MEAVFPLRCGGVELEKAKLDRSLGKGGVEVEHMVAALIVVGAAAAPTPAVAGVPYLREISHRIGFLPVQFFQEGGVYHFAIPANPSPVKVQRIRQEAFVAGHDVCKVSEGFRVVTFGADVDVDAAAACRVAPGPGPAEPSNQFLEGVHVRVGEDWGDHFTLFTVRPRDADIPLKFPLAALCVPG